MRNLLLNYNCSESLLFSRKNYMVRNTGFKIPQNKTSHMGDTPTGIYCGELVLKTFPEISWAPVSVKGCTQFEALVGEAHRGLRLEPDSPESLT